MFKISKKEKNLIWAAVGVIFFFLFINVIFRPLLSKVKNSQQKIRSAELRLKKSLIVQSRKDEMIEEYKRMQMYLNSKKDYSEQEIIGDFLKELEKIAQEVGLSVISLSPLETENEDTKIYEADFRSEGQVKNVLMFFDKLRESKLLMKVESFSLITRGEPMEVLKLDAVISMVRP